MHDLGAKPPQPPLPGRAAPLDEPGDRVVVDSLPAEEIGHRDQHGRSEKRELRTGSKQFGRLPDEHGHQRRREGCHSLGAAACARRQTGQPDHDRGPHHRRPRSDQKHVAAGDQERRQKRRAAADRQQLQEPADGVGENADMQSGDRQDVDRAGDGKQLGIGPIERRPLPEQQRGRQAGPPRGEARFEHGPPLRANAGQHRGHAQPIGRLDHANTLGGPHPDHRQAPIAPGLFPSIEIARIECRPGAEATAKHPHPITHTQLRRLPNGVEHGPTAGLSPHVTIPHLSHHDLASGGGRRHRPGQPWRGRGIGQQPWRLGNHPLDRNRHRRVAEAPGKIVGREETPARRRPRGHRGGDRHQERDRRRLNPPAPHQPCPHAQRQPRHGPPSGHTRERSRGSYAARRSSGDDDQRPLRERLTAEPRPRRPEMLSQPGPPCGNQVSKPFPIALSHACHANRLRSLPFQ